MRIQATGDDWKWPSAIIMTNLIKDRELWQLNMYIIAFILKQGVDVPLYNAL